MAAYTLYYVVCKFCRAANQASPCISRFNINMNMFEVDINNSVYRPATMSLNKKYANLPDLVSAGLYTNPPLTDIDTDRRNRTSLQTSTKHLI